MARVKEAEKESATGAGARRQLDEMAPCALEYGSGEGGGDKKGRRRRRRRRRRWWWWSSLVKVEGDPLNTQHTQHTQHRSVEATGR